MKSWAREINGIFGKLMSCEQELETLHKVYFEDISISEWKKEHDKYDGIAEHSREWHRLGVVSTSIVGIGAGAYSYSSNKKITSKNINDLPYNVQDSYTKYSNYSTKKINLHGIIMLLHMVLHKSR